MLVQDRIAAALKRLITRRSGREPITLDDGLHGGKRRDTCDEKLEASVKAIPSSRYAIRMVVDASSSRARLTPSRWNLTSRDSNCREDFHHK